MNKVKIQFIFKWYDLWIGFFYDKKKNWIYFLPIPMIGIIIKLPNRICKERLKIYYKYKNGDITYDEYIEQRKELENKYRTDNL
jgi:hypothetical protein